MTTVTTPDKHWENLFDKAAKDISLFQQAVLKWPNPPEATSQDLLIRIFMMHERGESAMNRINSPDLPEAYHPERNRLTHTWIEAEEMLFHRLDLCPEPEMLYEFAMNKLENDQTAHIKEHIGSCFVCQELVFETVMAEKEAIQKQGEAMVISDRFLSAISPDPASEFYKRLLNLIIIVNAHIKNRARDQSFQQKGFVFATASSDEQPFKGIDEIPFELIITPRGGLLEIPCTGDAEEGKTFIDGILGRNYFYTHVFAWNVMGERTDLGIFRHEHKTREISVTGFVALLMVLGLDGNAVEEVAGWIPEWLEEDKPAFNITDIDNMTILLYRIE